MLLILDNVEQLGDGTDVVARLLHAAPGPTILATSRGPLRLREEQRYPVESLTQDAAVEEFTDRARAVRPDLHFGPRERDAVVRIVDGVGSAAAGGRARGLARGHAQPARDRRSPGPSARAPEQRAPGPPRRQQTLRSTLLWSYDLLDEPARRIFAALAVFPGGATLDALEEVLPALRADLERLEPLDALVDQGLVLRSPDGSGRFTTLHVVRELAAELLDADADGPQVWRRAAERLAALAAQAAPQLVTAGRADWLDRVQAEHDNLRAVLAWATGHDAVLGASIAAPLWRYWQMRGYLREGRALLEALLEQLGCHGRRGAPGGPRCARRCGVLAAGPPGRRSRLRRGRRAWPSRRETRGAGGGAVQPLLRGLAAGPDGGGRRNSPTAVSSCSPSSVTATARRGCCGCAGSWRWSPSDLDGAERLFRESVERHRGGTDAFHLGWSLRNLGRTLLMQGRADEARALLEESLRLFAPAGDVSAIVLHLSDFATLAGLEGDVEREVRLAGAVQRLQRLTGTDLVDHPINAIPASRRRSARLGRGRRAAARRRAPR